MMLWATVMAVVLFLYEARIGNHADALWTASGDRPVRIYLGWRRRAAAVFVAPFVSWLFAWLPLWVAAMIHEGVLRAFSGPLPYHVGWIVIGFVEFAWLGAVAFLVRSFRGPTGRGDAKVVIFGPDDH